MKEIVNKVLLADDIFMLERHLKEPTPLGEPGFTKTYANNEKLDRKLHKPFIKKRKKEQFVLDLKAIFGVLI